MMFKHRTNINYILILLAIGVLCCVISVCVGIFVTGKDKSSEHIHSFDEWVTVKNPDCTNEGLRERYCACGERQESVIGALGHELTSFDAKQASCTEGGYNAYVVCSRCDYTTYEGIDALGHDYGEWELVTPASCTACGVEKWVCTRDNHVEMRQIEMVSHSMSAWTTVTEPTCTAVGERVRSCSACHTEESESINALGHEYGEWETVTPSTCTSHGSEQRICSRDNHIETRQKEMLAHSMPEWEIVKEVTCTSAGEKTRSCSVCHTEETEVIKALGHDYGEWQVVIYPTCTLYGLERRTCRRDSSHYEMNELKSKGHTPTDWLVEREVSCTEDGIEYIECSTCSQRLDERITEKTGHFPSGWIVDREPACEVEGLRHRECEVCYVTIESERLEVLGHKLEMFYDEISHYFKCSVCLKIMDESPHVWGDNECEICDYDAGGIKGLSWSLGSNGEYYVFNGFGSVPQSDDFEIPEFHNGKRVTAIGDAFRSFKGKRIVIPSFITEISDGAFFGCNSLEKLTLPFIGANADNPSFLGYLFGDSTAGDKESLIPVTLSTVEILDGITQLAEGTFKGCVHVRKIILHDSVVRLSEDCFYGCTALEDVALPSNLKYIASGAFWNCSSLMYLEVPANVEIIERYAFAGISSDCEIIFHNKSGWALFDGEAFADVLQGEYFDDIAQVLTGNNLYTYKRINSDGE